MDSWFEEVHYLVKEDGVWRIIGNAGGTAETPRFGHAPHPLFWVVTHGSLLVNREESGMRCATSASREDETPNRSRSSRESRTKNEIRFTRYVS